MDLSVLAQQLFRISNKTLQKMRCDRLAYPTSVQVVSLPVSITQLKKPGLYANYQILSCVKNA